MDAQFPKIWYFAVPNGGQRNKIVAAKLKQEGVKSGVPDIYVPVWKLWIEMKREKGGALQESQKAWRDYLLGIGDNYILAKGFSDAKVKVGQFLDAL